MPGTIQVSVLDLLDFPSSSSSTISIKVSMGKKEFRTWDKGDFSFPLTTLRDNIVVTIHDAEGKELSRTGVATMSVVEKGILDDFFVLEGGGRLHMKLQFILNSVERKRIQELREIALKKKQEEILIDRARHSEAAALSSFRSNVGSSSMSLNHEVTDSSESLVQKEAESSGAEFLRNADSRSKDPLSGSLNEVGVLAAQLAHPDPKSASIPKNPLQTPSRDIKDSIPGIADSQEILLDRSEEPIRSDIDGGDDLSTILVTEEPQIHHAKAEKQDIDKMKPQLPSIEVPASPGERTLSTILMSEKLPYGKSDEKVIDENETRMPPESLMTGDSGIVKITGTELTSSDTQVGAVSSLGASDNHFVDHSVSDTIGVDRDLNKSKSTLPPADVPVRPISSLEELDSRSSEDSVSSKFEEDQILNEDKTPTDIPLRRISSLVELNSHPGNCPISTKSEVERSLSNNETLIPPTDTPVRLTSSFKDLVNHSNSSKFGEVQMLNKSKMLVPTTDFPLRRISSHGNFGDHSRPSKLEEDRVVIAEKPSMVKRTPSNVRKMISAFETSQAKGQVIRADPPIIRSQPIKSKFNISPAESTVKEVTKDLNYIRERKDGGLEQNGKEARHAYETSQEESKTYNTLMAAETGSRLLSAVKTKERNLQESASEVRQQIPGQMPAAISLFETAAQLETCVQQIEKPIIVESACGNAKLIEDYSSEKCPLGSSGSCILTDESRPLCITTGSKQLMNLFRGSSNFSEADRGEKSSYQTDVTNEQNLHHNSNSEVQKIGEASDDTRKSNLEGPQNVIEGLIGQAGKVAAIVAFGALVIFARER